MKPMDEKKTLYCMVCSMAHMHHRRVPEPVQNDLPEIPGIKVVSAPDYPDWKPVTYPPLWYCVECGTVKYLPDTPEGT